MRHKRELEILRAARIFVADNKTWCRGSLARSATMRPVAPEDQTAASYCANGAVLRAAFDLGAYDVNEVLASLRRTCLRMHPACTLADVNDRIGRLSALAVIDARILELGGAP